MPKKKKKENRKSVRREGNLNRITKWGHARYRIEKKK